MNILEYAMARKIGNGTPGGTVGTPNAVQYVPQTLTPEQQKQARDNVGANWVIEAAQLPTTDIQVGCVYRVFTATILTSAGVSLHNYTCQVVDHLPENAEAITDFDRLYLRAYYSKDTRNAYGYIDSALATALGLSPGWMTVDQIASTFGIDYGGIISDVEQASGDLCILVSAPEDYIYRNGWVKLCYSGMSVVTWDTEWKYAIIDAQGGNCRGAFNISGSEIDVGVDRLVHVSDRVYTRSELLGMVMRVFDFGTAGGYRECTIESDMFYDTNTPGIISIDDGFVVVNESNESIPLGTYFGFAYNQMTVALGTVGSNQMIPQELIPDSVINSSKPEPIRSDLGVWINAVADGEFHQQYTMPYDEFNAKDNGVRFAMYIDGRPAYAYIRIAGIAGSADIRLNDAGTDPSTGWYRVYVVLENDMSIRLKVTPLEV